MLCQVRVVEDVGDDAGGLDTCEAEVEALVLESQFVVIHAAAFEDGSVEVAHVDLLVRGSDVKGILIGIAVGHATFDAGACHPEGEGARVMVTAIVGVSESALRVDGAAELTAEDDQGII